MSFRTVVISKQSKLSYKNRYLVVKKENEEKYIHLSEIDTVIVASIQVSVTTYLLKEFAENKINIIFCDEKHNPFGELVPYYSRYNSSKKIKEQIVWKQKDKDMLWQKIVKNKIINQVLILRKLHSDRYDLLLSYVGEVKIGDKTNREGHCAKVYFHELFGKGFSRNNNDSINDALNYGYSVLLSTFNKEVISNGYITQLGIHHKSEYNDFNLSCDLMEPFRMIIDNFVYHNREREFNMEYKLDLINIFNATFSYCNKKYILKDIINLYVKSTLSSLENVDDYKEFLLYEG